MIHLIFRNFEEPMTKLTKLLFLLPVAIVILNVISLKFFSKFILKLIN